MKSSEYVQGLCLLRRPQVQAKTCLSRTEIYRRIRRGAFPKPVKLGARTTVWNSADIDQWIAERLAGAKAAA